MKKFIFRAVYVPGVVAYLDHRDIVGKNNVHNGRFVEEIFCSGKVHYSGQAIGIIVAKTQDIANKAAKLVEITYKNEKKPVLTIRDAIKDKEKISTDVSLIYRGPMVEGDADIWKEEGLREFELIH